MAEYAPWSRLFIWKESPSFPGTNTRMFHDFPAFSTCKTVTSQKLYWSQLWSTVTVSHTCDTLLPPQTKKFLSPFFKKLPLPPGNGANVAMEIICNMGPPSLTPRASRIDHKETAALWQLPHCHYYESTNRDILDLSFPWMVCKTEESPTRFLIHSS